MIDEGQTDWKVIGIDVSDPLASKMSDVSDVDVYMPDLLKMTTNWFRIYKASWLAAAAAAAANKLVWHMAALETNYISDCGWKACQQVRLQCEVEK